MLKNTFERNAVAFALRYARRYPEEVDGHKVAGRVSLGKRVEFVAELSKLYIKDERVRLIALELTPPRVQDESARMKVALGRWNRLANLAVELNGGDREKAIQYLQGLMVGITPSFAQLIRDIPKRVGVKDPEKADQIILDVRHMLAPSFMFLSAAPEGALKQLKDVKDGDMEAFYQDLLTKW